jgi:hypothetical protein
MPTPVTKHNEFFYKEITLSVFSAVRIVWNLGSYINDKR